jgi:glycosyltransferase involved in cell wall biosynthesis
MTAQPTGSGLSVILAARNEASTITAQLEALLAQVCPEPWEVIVADNGSSDGTQDIVRSLASRQPKLRLLDASQLPGTPYARNHAAREKAIGDYLLFTDADDVVAPGWLVAMAAALRQTGFVAARLEHVRLNPSWTVAFRGTDQTMDLVARGSGPPWPYGYGTSLGIVRELHDAVGGFDESVGPCADMDYCFRVQRDTGARLMFAGDALIHYRHRTTLGATFRQARSYARDSMGLQRTYADVWREPVLALSPPHLALRATRRILFPDILGGRHFSLLRTRADLGSWIWQVGSDVGHLQGAREGDRAAPVEPTPK